MHTEFPDSLALELLTMVPATRGHEPATIAAHRKECSLRINKNERALYTPCSLFPGSRVGIRFPEY